VPCHRINKLGTRVHHRDRSAAAAIFSNRTYFLDNLRTSFQGLVDDIMLQYSFHELIFCFLIVAVYLALPSRYCVLHCCLRSSLFLVLWYLHLSAFNLFLIIVSSSVHQGTDLFDSVFFEAKFVLNDLLHANFKTSWNSSINFSMSVSSDTRVHSGLSKSSVPPSSFILQSFVSANRSRFPGISLCCPFSLYTSHLGGQIQSCDLCLDLWHI